MVLARLNGKVVQALVDTGCSQSMVEAKLVHGVVGSGRKVATVDGRMIFGIGETEVALEIDGKCLDVTCLVMPKLVDSVELIIGMDVINEFGGVVVDSSGAKFVGCMAATAELAVDRQVCSSVPGRRQRPGGVELCGAAAMADLAKEVTISDTDFDAHFDGEKWTVGWKWCGAGPPVLKNHTVKYAMDAAVESRFNDELEKWVAEGWLRPCARPAHGVIPLMAVEQPSKDKIRPVLDFRELNRHVESYTGDSDACCETTRKWRKMGGQPRLLDLRNAYLQLHVRKELWQYQTVQHQGKYYQLTRLGFGLNCAPKIMSAVLRTVLGLDAEIDAATDHYIDDIIVNVALVDLERVVRHLKRYGLETKSPERMEEARVLGLQLRNVPGNGLVWQRANELPVVNQQHMTRRELFSTCGKLVGIYPVAGWLRAACSYIKRHSDGVAWEDEVGAKVRGWLLEVIGRLRENDPAHGVWTVNGNGSGTVWCDASGLAVGVVVEMDNKVVEDACWLRKKDDGAHINVAELDAVLKGLNLALKWELEKVRVKTDSATVYGWLQSTLSRSRRIKTSGIAEMLVRRRLAMITELRDAYGMEITVELVRSAVNKADALTRVPQAWLHAKRPAISLETLHRRHHFGVKRTLHFARQVDPSVTRTQVQAVVKACRECASVDPAPIRWKKGELSVVRNWERLAVDVTHYGRDLYLTVVDCGPSRFAIWRKIATEDAAMVVVTLEQIFLERGPPSELLLDNSATFRSRAMDGLCNRWGVYRGFRCAYRPSGNGIVERNHRTIKSLAARTGVSPLVVLFWYNSAPLDDAAATVPASAVHSYAWRNPDVRGEAHQGEAANRYTVGDVVFIKPADAKCTTRWPEGVITAVNSTTCIDVNGMPRHVADCRPARYTVPDDSSDEDGSDDPIVLRRSTRTRRPPVRYPEEDS